MKEAEIQAAFAAYADKFGNIPLTIFGLTAVEREAAAEAFVGAVARGKELSIRERAALAPAIMAENPEILL